MKNNIEEFKDYLKRTYSPVAVKKLKQSGLFKKFKREFPWVESEKELVHCIKENIKEQPLCPICKKPLKVNKRGLYDKTCGNKKCQSKLMIKTQKQLYGVIGLQNVETYKKTKKSLTEKYGVDHNFKIPEIKEKIKKTNLEKYGVKYFVQSNEFKDKREKTCLEKYGARHQIFNEEIKSKILKSKQENNKKRFYQKYSNIINAIPNYYNEKLDKIDASKLCEDFNIHYSFIYKIWNFCNLDVPFYFSKNGSKGEKEIIEYIKSFYNGEIFTNTRKIISPLELDIYIPEYKFAIEYDGLYFHSFGKDDEINKNYHLEKTELCEEKDIHLFHIWENEWNDPIKQDIWKSKIAIKLHAPFINKIDARKCQIKEIDAKIAKRFLEENHLQGYINSKIKIGLFYNNELVSLMTFGKSRFKKNEFELYRFTSKKYTIVRGSFSKLFSYFLKNYNFKKVVSYGNRRWAYKINVYQKELKQDSITEPNYFYTDNRNIFSRFQFQKHKLKEKLLNFDENKTEIENVLGNNYRIIYDCGKFTFN